MKKKTAILAMIATLGSTPCFAASIWTNPITGANPSLSNPYTTGDVVVSNLLVSGLTRSAGLSGQNGANRYNADQFGSAFDIADYFSFILTPIGGADIDFNSFSFNGERGNGNSPTSFALRSSADLFAADIATFTNTGTAVFNQSVSLAAAAFQNVIGPIEFRLYGWSASNANGQFSVNDFTFDGTVTPVPEPTGAALLGALGGLGLLRRRR